MHSTCNSSVQRVAVALGPVWGLPYAIFNLANETHTHTHTHTQASCNKSCWRFAHRYKFRKLAQLRLAAGIENGTAEQGRVGAAGRQGEGCVHH